jgi:hypothetical protein
MQDSCTIWVCQCCMLSYANGECCADDLHGGDSVIPWSVENDFSNITMGSRQEEHICGRADDTYFGECDCEVNTFSWHACSGCGSRLAGERHAFTLWFD